MNEVTMQVLIDVFNGAKFTCGLIALSIGFVFLVFACQHMPWVWFPLVFLAYSWFMGMLFRKIKEN